MLGPLLVPSQADLATAVEIFERHEALVAFDALLAAVALNQGGLVLITADSSFAAVPGLPAVDPRSSEIDRLLA